jgi:hypothetical protein
VHPAIEISTTDPLASIFAAEIQTGKLVRIRLYSRRLFVGTRYPTVVCWYLKRLPQSWHLNG